MSSGSEFALRVALCDLVERFKRSEQKCKYLEHCRNELIKEIIRLRYENDSLTALRHNDEELLPLRNENSHHSKNSNSNSPRRSFEPVVVVEKADQSKPISGELTQTTSKGYSDESWEQITVRLINELKKEVASATAANDPRNGDERHCVNDNQKTSSATSGLSSDSSTTVHNSWVNFKQQQQQQQQQIAASQNSVKKLAAVDSDDSNPAASFQTDYLGKVWNPNPCLGDKLNCCNNNLISCKSEEPDAELVDAFLGAISNVKMDLETIERAISHQNEKLIRLKTKQLRNFFKRQINADDRHFHNTNLGQKNETRILHDN